MVAHRRAHGLAKHRMDREEQGLGCVLQLVGICYTHSGIVKYFGWPKILETVVQHLKAGDGGGIYTLQEQYTRVVE
ncbi:hypothetical protein BJX63DRAFT_390586 [Aspergillus granulosus]|uniref:Uncharacterized protein n=1 Tax=Aspergillus granulosus TaxID=176169 RepID=A0ABR4HI33_9EURO